MLQQIQDYLFRYKTVSVPEVGTFEVVHIPAALDVASQEIAPPVAGIRFSQQGAPSPHQLQAFALLCDKDAATVAQELALFGKALKKGLPQQPFHWQGIGHLGLKENDEVHFSALEYGGLLMPVPAQKVLRENVQHSVLVGDQELLYTADEFEAAFQEHPVRSGLLIFCWIMAACAVAFILYHLYTHNWSVEATGLQQKTTVESSPRQHQ